MLYTKISDKLYLARQDFISEKPVAKKESVNHIWIYDRSGSMSGTLKELTEQLIVIARKLPLGDTLTLGWFSGEGDYNFILKGFKITDASDYEALAKIIKANATTRGTTCFSEILGNTKVVIEDLSVFSKVFSLHFFTDGYPVVANYKKELTSIFEAIKNIRGKIHTAMFVGYGSYYNKELMGQMAEKLGALLIHSSMVPEYTDTITRLVKLSSSQEMKEEILPGVKDPLLTFMVTDQGIVLLSADEDGKLYVSPVRGKGSPGGSIFYITNKIGDDWSEITLDTVNFADADSITAKAIYAAAMVLTQQTKTDLALEFMGKIGDKWVVDILTNAFTHEEYGGAENVLYQMVHVPAVRFQKGRDAKYLPPVDAFCVFDLLTILTNDNKASFYPYHEKFEYEKIGIATKKDDEYPKFNAFKDSKSPMNSLVWHSSRLNLSVQTKIMGIVDLKAVDGKQPKDFGFSDIYPTFVYKNYTFIKDGRIHIKRFYVTTSETTYAILKNKGLVIDDEFSVTGIYGIDLSGLPAINRAIATGKTSATELCKEVLAEQKLKAVVKALKFLKDKEFGDETTKEMVFTETQRAFLMANGIDAEKEGIYSPPVAKEEAKDKYMAKYFDIKISGLMSLPTVNKVIEKIEAGKKRTPVEQLVEAGITRYQDAIRSMGDYNDDAISEVLKKALKTAKLKWLEEELANCQRELKGLRNKIQTTKFAVILGKKWFDEFTSRDVTELILDGLTYKFELGEEEVEI